MSCIRFGILLGLLSFLPTAGDIYSLQGIYMLSTPETKWEIYKEEYNVKREFCTVVAVCEEYFVLKNTNDEFYHIELSYLGSFKENDKVLLIYTERTLIEDGVYQAKIQKIFPDSSSIPIVGY